MRLQKDVFILIALMLPNSGCGPHRPPPEQIVYSNSGRGLIDEGRVSRVVRSDRELWDRLERFARGHPDRGSLARLIIAENEKDFEFAHNWNPPATEPALPINRKYVSSVLRENYDEFLGQSREANPIAMVFCLDGKASAWIRDGKETYRKDLVGSGDARERNIGRTTYRIQGFHAILPAADGFVIAFIRMGALPSADQAKAIQMDLAAVLRKPVLLTIRTDPFFWAQEGPVYDPFDNATRPPSIREFLDNPYVGCYGATASDRCLLTHLAGP